MKLLENSQLELFSTLLSTESGVSKITTRIESYSCKMAGDFKKLYKQMNGEEKKYDFDLLGPPITINSSLPTTISNNNHNKHNSNSINPIIRQQLSISPSSNHTSGFQHYMQSRSLSDEHEYSSSYGNIDIIPKKTLFYLRSTLNASFQPGYDFTSALSSEFSKEPSFDYVVKAIENYLTTVENYNRNKIELWNALDKEINLAECEFYSYNPDLTSDPLAEDGCLWFFNFFFYNKKLKRIMFFSCRCSSRSFDSSDTENEEEAESQLGNNGKTDNNKFVGFEKFRLESKASDQQLSTMIDYME
jgi:hypothetical protein